MDGLDINEIALPTLTLFLVIREVAVPLSKPSIGLSQALKVENEIDIGIRLEFCQGVSQQ